MKKGDIKEPSFSRGLLLSYLILLLSVPVVLIPLIGPILSLTLVPYLAGALGTRFAHPKERIPLALTCSLTWSILETAVLFLLLSVITKYTPMGMVIDPLGLLVVAIVWALNVIFMVLGTSHPWRDPFKEADLSV